MKINFKRLNHVQICVPAGDEDRARQFYSDLLGLREIPKPPAAMKNGGLWFEIADVQLHIGIEEKRLPSKHHPAFEVVNIGAVRAFLEENGIRTSDEPRLNGFSRFSLFDPFDNRIELMERVE